MLSKETAAQKSLRDRSDNEIIEEVKAGGKEAFNYLIERHAPKLFQASYGLLGSKEDAEETVQDTFVRAFRGLDKFRGDASFETWIYRIVINLSRNKYQWNKRRAADQHVSLSYKVDSRDNTESKEEVPIPDGTLGPEKLMEEAEFESNIMAGLDRLPENLRETMTLRHINDLPYEKIAELQDCKIGTVKSRIARGREILREFIVSLEGTPESRAKVTEVEK
jgi:RNA polymerase sigma-70 factor (ECF subfamily)